MARQSTAPHRTRRRAEAFPLGAPIAPLWPTFAGLFIPLAIYYEYIFLLHLRDHESQPLLEWIAAMTGIQGRRLAIRRPVKLVTCVA